jgi:hypothetical protein
MFSTVPNKFDEPNGETERSFEFKRAMLSLSAIIVIGGVAIFLTTFNPMKGLRDATVASAEIQIKVLAATLEDYRKVCGQ